MHVWDHKGPLIYYINALGLLAAGGARWGVWIVELFSLVIAASVSIYLFSVVLGPLPSIVATSLWLMTMPMLLDGGNLTEEYALPIQFVGLLCFYFGLVRRSKLLFLFVGTTAGMALLLRPNMVSVWLAMAVYLVLRASDPAQRKFCLESLRTLAVGSVAIVALPLAYFTSQGALEDLVDAVLVYNLAYVDSNLVEHLGVVRQGLIITLRSGLLFPSAFFWLFWLYRLIRSGPVWRDLTRVEPLAAVAFMAFPVEVLLSTMSGRIRDHYYLPWLPIMGLLAAYFFHINLRAATMRLKTNNMIQQLPLTLLVAALSVLSLWSLGRQTLTNLSGAVSAAVRATEYNHAVTMSDYEVRKRAVDSHSRHLLFWGAETAQNFLLGIPSPTRYVYQYPLYHCTYTGKDMVEEFLGDIVERMPVIVDTSSTNVQVPPMDPKQRAEWIDSVLADKLNGACTFPQSFTNVFTYLDSNYVRVGSYSAAGWPVYAHVSELPVQR